MISEGNGRNWVQNCLNLEEQKIWKVNYKQDLDSPADFMLWTSVVLDHFTVSQKTLLEECNDNYVEFMALLKIMQINFLLQSRIHLSICLSVCLSVYLSICLFIYLSIDIKYMFTVNVYYYIYTCVHVPVLSCLLIFCCSEQTNFSFCYLFTNSNFSSIFV